MVGNSTKSQYHITWRMCPSKMIVLIPAILVWFIKKILRLHCYEERTLYIQISLCKTSEQKSNKTIFIGTVAKEGSKFHLPFLTVSGTIPVFYILNLYFSLDIWLVLRSLKQEMIIHLQRIQRAFCQRKQQPYLSASSFLGHRVYRASFSVHWLCPSLLETNASLQGIGSYKDGSKSEVSTLHREVGQTLFQSNNLKTTNWRNRNKLQNK